VAKAKKPRGKKDKEAELLCEKWLAFLGLEWVHRYRRASAGPNFSFSHDLFKSIDFQSIVPASFAPFDRPKTMFKRCTRNKQSPGFWFIQVTTQGGRTARRRKIEKVDWPPFCRVDLFTHEVVADPANRRRRMGFWRVEEYAEPPVSARSKHPSGRVWLDPFALALDITAIEEHAKAARAEKRK